VTRKAAGLDASPPRQVVTLQDASFLDDFVATADGRFLFARSSGTDRLSVVLN
jgi:hypothetical protein